MVEKKENEVLEVDEQGNMDIGEDDWLQGWNEAEQII